MKKYGLIGKKLNYSFSKTIHNYLIECYKINATYDLIELDELNEKMLHIYDGLNITIPYKEEVIKHLDNLNSPIDVCNTIKNSNGLLVGYNTDLIGFSYLVKELEIENIEKVVVLGSGATSKMVSEYFKDCDITIISRNDIKYNYEYLNKLQADILVNTTPVGMSDFKSPISDKLLTNYKGVIDLNYNPLNSKLSLDCKKNDVKFINGLDMLIKQACAAFEIWHNLKIDDSIIAPIKNKIYQVHYSNKIALIGMPLGGKSTIIRMFDGIDLDQEIENDTSMSINELITNNTFRDKETEVLEKLVNSSVNLIALGGGAILKHRNLELLSNYLIVFLDTPLTILLSRYEKGKRPLLKSKDDLINTYKNRYEIYTKYANVILTSEKVIDILKSQT